GWPVEFLTWNEIQDRYGPEGITDPVPAPHSGKFEITDDTQMTLFTAEGLLRSNVRAAGRGMTHGPAVVFKAYRRWYRTQTTTYPGREAIEREIAVTPGNSSIDIGSRLLLYPEMWQRRAPGNTCLSSLSQEEPTLPATNGSKGCGTVMKTAPIGLLCCQPSEQLAAARHGLEIAAVTHGHPTAQIAAAFLSSLIGQLTIGNELRIAIVEARRNVLRLCDEVGGEFAPGDPSEVLEAIDMALALDATEVRVTPDIIERLGGGWVAEEALAIALLCAIRAKSFEEGVRLAVNHSGDSDSTGAIAGNILGVIHGVDAIPSHWLEHLELHDVIAGIADDLHECLTQGIPCVAVQGYATDAETLRREAEQWEVYDRWARRYPGT
ncbi:MAG: ADP-ribosylglycohydrolase family protein, partial [Planctomycetota bacterium]